jgi:hypothetical protein
MARCLPNEQRVLVKLADPENDRCCDEYRCVAVVNQTNAAVGSDTNQFSQNSQSGDSVPMYAIALLVIGGLVLVGLITVIVLVHRVLKS